jgi:hypothetical protein
MLKRRHVGKGGKLPYDDQRLIMKAMILGGAGARPTTAPSHTAYSGRDIVYHRWVGE